LLWYGDRELIGPARTSAVPGKDPSVPGKRVAAKLSDA
jgi:hypothetical protein